MYFITKEDKNLFDKCVNHMSQKAGGKLEEDYSSTVLSQDPTLNTDSSDDKNDESTPPTSEEVSTLAKETSFSQNVDGATAERSVVEDIEKESTKTYTPSETKSKKKQNKRKMSTSKMKKLENHFSLHILQSKLIAHVNEMDSLNQLQGSMKYSYLLQYIDC